MLQRIVEINLMAAGAYLVIGSAFALAFQVFGLAKVDPAAKGAGLPFRLFITPGLVALWPAMTSKWWNARSGQPLQVADDRPFSPRGLRRAHGLAAKFAALFLPIVLALGLYGRSDVRSVAGPVREKVGLEAKQYDRIVSNLGAVFPGLPIDGSIRMDGEGNCQLALRIGSDFGSPTMALFWSLSEDPKEGSLLGLIWGPGERRLALPKSTLGSSMRLLLYSMTDHEVSAMSAPIDLDPDSSAERG